MDLCREPDIDDGRRVVFSIDPDNALGPDGFCSRFYQCYWDIIYCNLLDVILDYLRGSTMPRRFHNTLLVLLPRKTYPASWANFNLISLCSMSNNVLTKLLVLRLAPLLPRIISPSQSDFVSSTVIQDNVFVVQELVYDHNRHAQWNNVVLKLDMGKDLLESIKLLLLLLLVYKSLQLMS